MSEAEDIIARSKARAEAALRAYLDCLVPPAPFDMSSPDVMREHVTDLLADLMHLWHDVPSPGLTAGDPPWDGDDWIYTMLDTAQANFAEELGDAMPGGDQ